MNPLTDVSGGVGSVDRVDHRFQRFYAQNYVSTVRLARLLTGAAHVAEDIAQDAFVKVFRYAETSQRPIENPAALLRTTTVNLCRTWYSGQLGLSEAEIAAALECRPGTVKSRHARALRSLRKELQ